MARNLRLVMNGYLGIYACFYEMILNVSNILGLKSTMESTKYLLPR
jgi:hypothetical protein